MQVYPGYFHNGVAKRVSSIDAEFVRVCGFYVGNLDKTPFMAKLLTQI